jgi:cell wall-associated NlpC family hydrolase
MNNLFKRTFAGVTTALTLTAFGATAYANGQVGTVTANTLNVRNDASTSAAVITQIHRDGQVSVLESSNGWYKVSFGNTAGWVSAKYLSVTSDADSSPVGTISGGVINVRTGPSTSHDIIMKVVSGEKVNILGSDNGWCRVKFSTGLTGWVKSDYVSKGSGNIASDDSSQPNVASRGSSLGSQIVSYAQRYMGIPYVYGGSSPSGADCSGFVKMVYHNFGISLNRVAVDQSREGTYVSTSNLSPGDLLFFATSGPGKINHVGIYIGNGQFIHASSGAGKVTVSSLQSSFYSSHFVTARTLTR